MSSSNTSLRIKTAFVIVAVFLVAFLLEAFGIPHVIKPFHAIRWLGVLVMLGAIYEFAKCIKSIPCENTQKNLAYYIGFGAWLVLMMFSVYFIGNRPWIILLLLMIIAGADTGAWLFGKIFGGDKMWERLSEHKTWSGQIGGIVCGTFMSVMYGLLGTDVFRPELLWIGIGVSLLSQYGDLTASFIKRKMEIKDFGNTLPGHGGIIDRIDGWIYVLPLLWFIVG